MPALIHRPLHEADLRNRGPFQRLGSQLCIRSEINSTNAVLLDNAADLPDGAVATAELQTHGRGRLGRRWDAPRGSSVLLSILLIEPQDTPLTQYAAMIAALAVREAIRATTDCPARLRWPNDLVIRGRKVAGILAESTPLPQQRRAIVVGIGINCLQHAGHFPESLRASATSLEIESKQAIDRAAVASELLAQLDRAFRSDALERLNWTDLRSRWTAHSDDLDSHVTLRHLGSDYSGTIFGFDEDGNLLVELDNGDRKRFESSTTTRLW